MEVSVALNAAGDGVEAVVALPPRAVSSAADVVVEVLGDNTLLIQTPGCDQPLRLVLPLAVNPNTGRVRFKRATGKLTFTASAAPTAAAASATAGNGVFVAPVPADAVTTATPTTTTAAESLAALSLSPIAAAPQAGCIPAEQPAATTPPSPPPPSPPPPARQPGATAAPVTAAPPAQLPPSPAHSSRCTGAGEGLAEPAAPGAAAACSVGRTGTDRAGGGVGGGGSSLGGGCVSSLAINPLSGSAAGRRASAGDGSATTTSLSVTAGANDDGDNDDAALYRDFYCDSPPAAKGPGSAVHVISTSQEHRCAAAAAATAVSGGGEPVNAARVAAAFEPTVGTSSRDGGFSFTAPDLPLPPPLPRGLPPVAPPIDCRYLAVANGLRLSGHASTAALAELMGMRRRPSAAAERRKADRAGEILQRVADTLDAYGYAVLDNYISEAAITASRSELRVMEPHYSPGLIWVGKEAETGAQISVSAVRGDTVLWLDDQALNATAFVKDGVRRHCSFMQLQQMLADVDELVFEGLRPRLSYLAGLHRRSDAMMAVYPGKGARFAKHVDNTTTDGRRLTVLTYLNPGWQELQGGALRLFPVRQGAAGVVDVLPLSGRVALFLSAEVAHEVMPSFAMRHAVTLWYFDAGEHAAALTAAKVLPGASSRPTAQAAATALLRDLLADEAASGIQATMEGCAELGTRVAALEPGAQQLLAAVLGLPGATALVETMRGLTPDSLRRRREELRNMGLGAQHHAPDTSAHV